MKRTFANVLYQDGHVSSLQNKTGQFTVDVRRHSALYDAFSQILLVLKRADAQP